jgi:hypothetical protein
MPNKLLDVSLKFNELESKKESTRRNFMNFGANHLEKMNNIVVYKNEIWTNINMMV